MSNRPKASLPPLIRLALSPRQGDVAELMVQGLQISEISEKLGLAERTVKTHIDRIYQRYVDKSARKYKHILLIRMLLCQ